MSTYDHGHCEPHPGYVEKTPYAHGYQSRYTEDIINRGGYVTGHDNPCDLQLLDHVNCGYLSTQGVPPTLLALKQHAQSLAVLISQITISSQYAEVDNKNNADGRIYKSFRDNEAFDWLNDLSMPYENDDEWHHKPLTDLMNVVARQSDTRGTEHHCPLQKFSPPEEGKTKLRPYASHSALAMHANECLEVLDHEYSATGGLMSLLPTDAAADAEDMVAVRNSLLGQFLLFSQHLVARMHDLELSYANALDVTAGEAAVPMQMLSKVGPDGTSGREVAYPQDKWILANAGDDVFDHLHRALDRQEAQIKIKQQIYTANGTYGERMWNEQRGGDLYARGLVFYDVMTRFFRLQGKGKSTIFMLPAHGEHPAVQQTRRIEVTPTVVSVVTPTWPARVSEWEKKYRAKLEEADEREIKHHDMTAETFKMREHNETLATELQSARLMNEKFETYYTTSEAADGAAVLERKAAALEAELAGQKARMEQLEKLETQLEKLKPHLPASFKGFLYSPLPGQTEPLGAAMFRDAPATGVSD
ncbi:hypothetical protein CKAH01_12049 [Colletotrichum kahawae]|uniref:Uncharacterized protein n=1 Tax=Colletotrichum kahawae TaxID=34407 RepID=A0AAE0DCZ0_COLKA|nr:hypothetical protein CKAH01_12049 [Colletotrichum kahawae]